MAGSRKRAFTDRIRLALSPTSAARLPDFIVAGAQKSGTSTLRAWLSQHPEIVVPRRKEIHYFDGGLEADTDLYARGPAWYARQFPAGRGPRLSFDATPLYLFNPLVAMRIAALLPSIKIIVLLRDPVARAISHYHHEVRLGYEDLPLEQALEREAQRLDPVLASGAYRDPAFIHHAYQARGRYAEQLQRYFRHFPSQQLLVMQSETVFSDPRTALKRIFEFLAVDNGFRVAHLEAHNVGAFDAVDDAVLTRLRSYFQPLNAALFDLLGTRYDW